MIKEQMQSIKDESRELSKAMSHLYNTIILNCQKKCLYFDTKSISNSEKSCLLRCANESMFLDNLVYELDSATQAASTQDKPKKAFFYYSRRIDDVTSD